jgi:hypothetical protein
VCLKHDERSEKCFNGTNVIIRLINRTSEVFEASFSDEIYCRNINSTISDPSGLKNKYDEAVLLLHVQNHPEIQRAALFAELCSKNSRFQLSTASNSSSLALSVSCQITYFQINRCAPYSSLESQRNEINITVGADLSPVVRSKVGVNSHGQIFSWWRIYL